jgi:tripartite-type tricarboxylate transporter receptor subunit TctC
MRNRGRSWPTHLAILLVLALVLAACADEAGTETTADGGSDPTTTAATDTTMAEETSTTQGETGGSDACDGFPSTDIEFVVPYSTGGGFDTWARILGPEIERYLPNDVSVVVVNREGAGGLVGVSELFNSEPDGHTIAITEPGTLATAVIGGQTDLDLSQLAGVAQLTVLPEVIVVSGSSEYETIEDVQAAAAAGETILSGTGGLAAINIVAFGALGIPLEHVQHDGSSEALLSIVRGDTAITVFPLTSVAEGITAGDLRPLVVVGGEPSGPGADTVDGVPLIDDVVEMEGFGAALEQHRIVVAPPGTPECALNIVSDAIELAFAESGFASQLDDAGLVPVFMNAPDTTDLITLTMDTLSQYEEELVAQLGG